MEILPATAEQIALFKKSAAERYAELGVKPEYADILFEMELGKIAYELGIGEQDAKAAGCSGDVGATKPMKAKKKFPKKALALATKIAESLGRKF